MVGLPNNLPKSLREADATLRKELSKQWNSLSDAAKRKACESLDIEGLDCSDLSLDKISKALGATGGAYLCASTGAGVVLSSACGSFGAWLGKHFGSFLGGVADKLGYNGSALDECSAFEQRMGHTNLYCKWSDSGVNGLKWGQLPLYVQFKWAYQKNAEPGYDWPLMRKIFVEKFGLKAFKERLAATFPGYVPSYSSLKPASSSQTVAPTSRESKRKSGKTGPIIAALALGGGLLVFLARR